MIKHVSINRFEGNGIIERIEGNGWDIDVNHIEMNGINAHIIDNPENRIISLNGPAVEDLFKSLRDLLKENGKLRENIEMKKARIRMLNNKLLDKNIKIDVLNNSLSNYYELSEKCSILEKQDEHIKTLEKSLIEKEAVIRALQFDKDHYKESCKILERSIEEKNDHINMLDKLLSDRNVEIDELKNKLKKYDYTQIPSIIRHNNELVDKCNFFDSVLPLAVKMNPILNFIKETRDNNIDYAKKTLSHFMPGYNVTVSVSRQEDDDNG